MKKKRTAEDYSAPPPARDVYRVTLAVGWSYLVLADSFPEATRKAEAVAKREVTDPMIAKIERLGELRGSTATGTLVQ